MGKQKAKQLEVEFSNSEPCCCGSGTAYAQCCKGAQVKCLRDARGRSSRFLIADEKLHNIIEDAEDEFRQVFGRKQGSRDLILNAGLLYSDEEMTREFERAAKAAGTPGHLIYAYRETGLILSNENYERATPEDREDWETAVAIYLDAQENGIDLNEPQTQSAKALAGLPALLSNLVVHLGSYCHRAPKAVRTNQPIFFQFLMLSQCHRSFKVVMDRFESAADNEIFALLRNIYECSLLIASLSTDPKYSNTLLAQALAGNEHFPYRRKKNGDPDYGRLVDIKTGVEFESRVSFSRQARFISDDDYAFFELIYPDLSSGVHFDSGNSLLSFMNNGRFLNIERKNLVGQLIRILIISDYLLTKFIQIDRLPNMLMRDASFMKDRLRRYLYSAYSSFDEDDLEVDEHTSILMFACMNDYKLPQGD